jgi:hypothetical protein
MDVAKSDIISWHGHSCKRVKPMASSLMKVRLTSSVKFTKAFLKSARDDRESYAKELCNHQARDNPHIAQAMETQMTIPYCNSTSLSNLSDRPDGGKNIDQATLTIFVGLNLELLQSAIDY